MPNMGTAILNELGAYIDNEINNRGLTVDVASEDGKETRTLDLISSCFRTGGPNKDTLEIYVGDGEQRCGVSIKFEVTDEVTNL